MTGPKKTILKSNKPNMQSRAPLEGAVHDKDVKDFDEISPASVKYQGTKKTKGKVGVRRHIDFKTLDIRSAAGPTRKPLATIGAIVKKIEEKSTTGISNGQLSVSLRAIQGRINLTKSGSMFVLFIDVTGSISVFVSNSSMKEALMSSSNPASSPEDARANSVVFFIQGDLKFRPSTMGEGEYFCTLDKTATMTPEPLDLTFQTMPEVPFSLGAVYWTLEKPLNAGFKCPIVVATYMNAVRDVTTEESTITLLDCTGYGFINIFNAPKYIMGNEDNENRPIVIAGDIEFTRADTIDAVTATVDFTKCYIAQLDSGFFKHHKDRIKKIPVSNFCFDEPFIE